MRAVRRFKLAAALVVAISLTDMAEAAVAAEAPSIPVREGFAMTPDGIRLYYRVAGNGPNTVMAPFALYHRGTFDRLAKDRRIVTYDPRGRGKSDPAPLDRVSLDYLLMDLETVRRAVNAEKIAIIGWSGSGMETFVYALRNPDRVTRLVQLAPVTARAEPYVGQMMADRRKRTDGAAWTAFQDKIKAGDFANDPAAHCRAEAAVTVPALLASPASVTLIPDVCDSANEQPPTLGAYFGALWPSISSYDWREQLGSVAIPRLAIYPRQDNISQEGVEEWVRGQAGARIIYLDGSGHFPHYEQAEATLAAIEQFLSGQWPRDSQPLP